LLKNKTAKDENKIRLPLYFLCTWGRCVIPETKAVNLASLAEQPTQGEAKTSKLAQ
jgi:hypothetical protein